MVATHPDNGITRAILTVHLESGEVLQCDGRPTVETFSIGVDIDRIDFSDLRTMSCMPPKPQTTVRFDGAWTNPKTMMSTEARTRWQRFKRWLCDFPTS